MMWCHELKSNVGFCSERCKVCDKKLLRPDFEITVTLLCPKCGNKLITNVCEQCGQVIETASFNVGIDINPEEIL